MTEPTADEFSRAESPTSPRDVLFGIFCRVQVLRQVDGIYVKTSGRPTSADNARKTTIFNREDDDPVWIKVFFARQWKFKVTQWTEIAPKNNGDRWQDLASKGWKIKKNKGALVHRDCRLHDRYGPVDLKHATKPAETGPASIGAVKSGLSVF